VLLRRGRYTHRQPKQAVSSQVHDELTSTAVLEAIRAVQRHQFAYWDALIWATAKLQGIPNVLTEDRSSSALVEGVRFVDPFTASFDLALLG
jgi:predicted nucleic acid-binding protein